MKKIFLFLSIIGIIIYFNCAGYSIDPTIYRGNGNVFGGIYVTSTSISGNAANANFTPLISSITYINKADVTLKNDTGGLTVWISSCTTIHASGDNGYKLYAGESISCGGKNLGAIYARTLAGTGGTTIWYIISYQDR